MFQRRGFPWTWAAGILIPLSLSACRKEEALPRIEAGDIQVEVGLGGAMDRSRWNLFRLEVRNQGEDFRGELLVEGDPGISQARLSQPVVYRTLLEIPGQATTVREVTFPVRPEGWEGVTMTLRQPGYSKAYRFPLEPEESVRLRVLAIGRRVPRLEALAPEVESILEKKDDSPSLRFHAALPEELPDIPRAYDPFGLVVLFGSTLAEAPPGALEALRWWVESGGTLAVFPGEEWGAGLPERFLALLGVSAGDPEATLPPALAREIGPAASRGIYRALEPASGTLPLAGGIALRAPRGAGSVTTFSFLPGGPSFPEASSAPGLYEPLRPALSRALSFAGNSAAGLRNLERVVGRDLFAMSGFRAPGRAAVSVGLGVYLMLGFLLPAFIFRRLRKPELTFAWIILAAALATWGIYRFGVLSALDAAEVEEITILRLHRDGKTAEATSFLGLIGPSMRRVDLETPEGALPQPLRAEEFDAFAFPLGGDLTSKIVVEVGEGPRAASLTLHPNAMRYLRYDYRISPERLVTMEERNGQILLRNHGPESLRVFLFEEETCEELTVIPPGKEKVAWPRKERLFPKTRLPPQPFEPWKHWPQQDLNHVLQKIFRILNWPGESLWPGAPQPPRELRASRQSYLVALAPTPVFPGGERIGKRKAVVVMVLELLRERG